MSAWMRMAIFLSLSLAAMGQELATQRSLTLPIAKTMAEAALAACQEQGFHTTVVVVDRAGQVMVVLRDENASAVTLEMAQRKAYTARMFGNTLEFQKRTEDPKYIGQRDIKEILALGGGVPIQVDGETIGGIASSGAGQAEDDACAKAGVAKVAASLK